MTIQTETSKVVYNADGNTKEFPVPFYFFANQIMVYQNLSDTPLEETTDYIVKNKENYNGGTVEFITTPASGDIITITRHVELKQLISFLEGENFPAVDFEHALDKLTMGLQQFQEYMTRAVVVPHGSSMKKEDIFHCLAMLEKYWNIVINLPSYIDSLLNSTADVVEKDNSKLVTSAAVYDFAYDKASVNEKVSSIVRKLKDTEITITAYTAPQNSGNADYPFRYLLSLEGVTEKDCPVVMFKEEDAIGGNFAPFAKAYNGGIMLYLKKNNEYTTTIPLILLL